jgi:ubiquinone/menaquinone biosynthesis C-methylase UbiE
MGRPVEQAAPAPLMASFNEQFAHPQGPLGSVAGWLMAFKNRQRNSWTLDLLKLQPTDHILEIGFGPGWAIEQAAKRLPRGHVDGVDTSATILKDASNRNAKAIRNGQVRLQTGSETPLPFNDGSFNKVFAVNSFQFWNEPEKGLLDVLRVLKPGGLLAVTVQPMWIKTDEDALRYGGEVQHQIVRAGFVNVRVEALYLKPLCLCIIGHK